MKYKLIIATWLALLPLCLFAQLEQVKSSYSSGNKSHNGHICVAGIPATNAANITTTGYSTTIGFLAMEEEAREDTTNTAPIAHAGMDQAIIAGNEFTLDGTASFDPDNDALTYLWTSLEGITLQDPTTINPSFSTEDIKAIATLQFVLTVNDGELESAPDTVALTLTHPDWIPVTATNSATFYGLVTFDGTNAAAEDWVAAYIDGINRGVSQIKMIKNEPYVIFNIQADMEGEASFKLYDASEDQICEVGETTLILPGFDIGTPAEPIELNGSCDNAPISGPNTCNLNLNNTSICAGRIVIAQYDCALLPAYTYEWDFDGAINISGKDLGPYELNWETSGIKKVAIRLYQNGNLISTVSQPIEVLAVDLQEVMINKCTGEIYEFDGEIFTESTFHVGEFINQNGCDSLVLLNLIVTDTACQSTSNSFNLSGTIVTDKLLPVEDVLLGITKRERPQGTSNREGKYVVEDILYHKDSTYTLRPTKMENPLNGISTADILLLTKFLVGLHQFDSPYQYIAADVNNSGTITAVDIVELRALILNKQMAFSNNTVWRFVDADFKFPPIETTDPLTIDFPETITPSNMPSDSVGHNFIAIKIGDINGSILTSRRNKNRQATTIHITNQEIAPGQTATIELTSNVSDLAGFQFTLQFDPTQLAILDIKEQLLKKENIGISQLAKGLLSVSWIGKANTNKLLELTVLGKTATSTRQAFQIAAKPLSSEGYDDSNQVTKLDLNFTDVAKEHAIVLYQNKPNPFSKKTHIPFYLPKATNYLFKIIDINGRIIKEIKRKGHVGINELYLNQSFLKGTGIYYYQLISDNQISTKKMILKDD